MIVKTLGLRSDAKGKGGGEKRVKAEAEGFMVVFYTLQAQSLVKLQVVVRVHANIIDLIQLDGFHLKQQDGVIQEQCANISCSTVEKICKAVVCPCLVKGGLQVWVPLGGQKSLLWLLRMYNSGFKPSCTILWMPRRYIASRSSIPHFVCHLQYQRMYT